MVNCERKKERTMKKTILIAAMMLAMPTMASAVCVGSGYVDRVTTLPGTRANSTVYVRTSSTAPFIYSVLTRDAKLIDAALNAVTSRTRVQFKASAAACPKAGSIRKAGNLQYLILAP